MKNPFAFLKGVIFLIVSLLVFLSLFSYTPHDISFLSFPVPSLEAISNYIGLVGAWLAFILFSGFGKAAYFFPFYFFFSGLDRFGLMRFSGLGRSLAVNSAAFILFIVFLSVFLGLVSLGGPEAASDLVFEASGMTGFFLAGFFKKTLGASGSFITTILAMTVNALLLFSFFFVDLAKGLKQLVVNSIDWIKEFRAAREESSREKPSKLKTKKQSIFKKLKEEPEDAQPQIKVYAPKLESKTKKDALSSGIGIYTDSSRSKSHQSSSSQAKRVSEKTEDDQRKIFDPRTYKLPTAGILKVPPFPDERETKSEIKANIKSLESALADFDVEAKVVSVQKGPVITMYELSPQSGTKINKISALADDIALSMKSSSVRIVAPLPGKGTIGVEIPNSKKNFVFLREVLEEKTFINAGSKLSMAIGKDVSGNPVVADLNDMPHLLIAGATGAGKTVCVNSIICSMLFKAKPDEVKFIMVDPKMVELAHFSGIPHLIHPIITESKKAFFALNWAVEEMERRYKTLAEAGARNIGAYNKGKGKLPYIVVVVDELADLMLVARESIETTIQRLAQLSRAVGIHLILATQRPSVDVITGVIKANFPARISFKVSSKVDSRTVLDVMGADKLLGKGDLLFLDPGTIGLTRAQASFLDDEDIENLTDFIKAQGRPVYEEAIVEGEKKISRDMGSDELFDDAVKIILQTQQASASLLQRRMRVGYTRAARLLDLMEQAEIVGPFRGSKAREIIVNPEQFLTEKGWK